MRVSSRNRNPMLLGPETRPMTGMSTAYESDFYAWARENAALLRSGQLSRIDLEHIAEELEDMGKSERRALGSHLR